MKQGPFPRPRLCCPRAQAVLRASPPPSRLDAISRVALIRARCSRPDFSTGPGPGRASPVPASTLRAFRSQYPGGFFAAAAPGSSRLPWPSPSHSGLGSPFPPPLGEVPLTRRQDSRDVTDRSLARLPEGGFVTGLRRRAFPPDAASQLPGALVLTGTGLSPAGECERGYRYVDRDVCGAGRTSLRDPLLGIVIDAVRAHRAARVMPPP